MRAVYLNIFVYRGILRQIALKLPRYRIKGAAIQFVPGAISPLIVITRCGSTNILHVV